MYVCIIIRIYVHMQSLCNIHMYICVCMYVCILCVYVQVCTCVRMCLCTYVIMCMYVCMYAGKCSWGSSCRFMHEHSSKSDFSKERDLDSSYPRGSLPPPHGPMHDMFSPGFHEGPLPHRFMHPGMYVCMYVCIVDDPLPNIGDRSSRPFI